MGKFDLSAVMAAQNAAPAEDRTIETVTMEILDLKKTAGESILGIGQRLIEAKAMLSHGEWLPWLTEQVEFSERTAQNFMRLSREWSNPQTLADLGASKALTLLALPPEEREQFIAEPHDVNGEQKNVIDMSARQLEQVIKERDDARMAAEHEAANAKAAEESRAKMESEMAMMKGLLKSAQDEKDKSAVAVAELEKQLAELKAAPVDVAVMAVDQAALDRARADAVAEMQDKLDKAKEAKAKADEKRKAAEEELAKVQAKYEAAVRESKQALISSDKDMATFEILFNQAQETVNKLQGLLIKMRGRDDKTMACAIQKAMMALADAIGRAAE